MTHLRNIDTCHEKLEIFHYQQKKHSKTIVVKHDRDSHFPGRYLLYKINGSVKMSILRELEWKLVRGN
jgi:hypothetical protein